VPRKQGPVFEWDQTKSDKNLAERGFDFAYASRIFDGDVLEWEDTRREYGGRRVVAIGEVDKEVYVVVYTWRGEVRRIISARPASGRERSVYHQTFASRNQ
jgi:uncharacterized DUF497 family protein